MNMNTVVASAQTNSVAVAIRPLCRSHHLLCPLDLALILSAICKHAHARFSWRCVQLGPVVFCRGWLYLSVNGRPL